MSSQERPLSLSLVQFLTNEILRDLATVRHICLVPHLRTGGDSQVEYASDNLLCR
jgi:hypothetical protein